MNKLFPILILLFGYSCKTQEHKNDNPDSSRDSFDYNTTIAFGSCNKADEAQVIWESILANEPDRWIWTGDIIYGDTEDMGVLKRKYDEQKNSPEYSSFSNKVPILGIWDDHDYGVNDGDKTYKMKAESRDLLYDFLDVPENNLAWNREGAYQSYVIGEGDSEIKIILLDARYFRDTLEKDVQTEQRYVPNQEGDILGDEQWTWLSNELTNSSAKTHIIASGIQIIPIDQNYEKWANFPTARERLLKLINELQPSNPLFISGDRHMAEISAIELDNYEEKIYEITSSGMTHTWSDTSDRELNRFRIGEQVVRKNFGLIHFDEEGQALSFEIRNPKNELLLRHELE